MTYKPTKPFLNKLNEWNTLRAQISELEDKELEMRKELFAIAFPNPEEGSKYNKVDLPNGYMLQGDYKINRRVDEGALPIVREEMDPVLFARTFRFKPELSKSGFKELTDEQKRIASKAIIAAPGTPSLAIVQKK